MFCIFLSRNGTRNSGRILPSVITHAIVEKTVGSVISVESPPVPPNASMALVAAGTSYEIAPITVSLIHGRTVPSAPDKVSTVATIASAGATVKRALETTVFLREEDEMPSSFALFHALTMKKTD